MATVRRAVPGVRGWISAAVLAVVMALAVQGTAEADPVKASYYGAGDGFAGQVTASGEVFNPYADTAAHPTLPFGTELQVTYQGQTTYVTVNDRGPYAGDRGLDLSYGAAQDIGLTGAGVDVVDVEVVG